MEFINYILIHFVQLDNNIDITTIIGANIQFIGTISIHLLTHSLISYSFLNILVVIQSYEAEADNEYVIRGNSAIMKCEIPSYVADFVSVDLWTDSNGGSYHPNNVQTGTLRSSHVVDLNNDRTVINCALSLFIV